MSLHARTAIAVVVAFAAGLYTSSTDAIAQQAPSTAVCVSVPQTQDGIANEAVAAWMTQQIAIGRVNFESITALGTSLCAW